MEHPLLECRIKQADFLKNVSEEDRPFHERLFRVGNASYIYYEDNIPSVEDYESWLEGLDEPMKTAMSTKGYEQCITTISLKRHSLERSDIGMEDFMRQNLTKEDYDWWRDQATTE